MKYDKLNNPVENQMNRENLYSKYSTKNLKVQKDLVGKIEKNKDELRQFCSFVKAYPDIFLDMITPKDSNFKLHFYQRLFLRAAMRNKYMFGTFTRGFSKSFLNILVLYLKCIFYPRSKIFLCSATKEQSSNIAKEKIAEIKALFPALAREIKEEKNEKDYVRITFLNGSFMDILAVQSSSRGMRRTSGLVDECILVDGQVLSEVIIPTMNVDRIAANGIVDPDELHKQQWFITSAGYKSTFAYQKMIQILVWMITREDSFCWGGDWEIPSMHGILSKNFLEEIKEDATYDPMSFDREYGSKWSGTSADAFFDGDIIDRQRKITAPEFERDTNKKDVEYIVSVDVARTSGYQSAGSEAVVIKATPRSNGIYKKEIVNIFSLEASHFNEQACNIKRIVQDFGANQLVVDANGLGIGLVDYLVKESIDEKTGEIFPPYSVTNDPEYDKYRTTNSLPLLYNVKSQGIASNIHVNCLSQISSGKVTFLVDEMAGKTEIEKLKTKKDLSEMDSIRIKAAYVLTSILKEEMLNLQRSNEGKNITLKQMNKRIQKDKFSALEYGLWYLKTKEDQNLGKINDVDLDQFLMIRTPKWTMTYGR